MSESLGIIQHCNTVHATLWQTGYGAEMFWVNIELILHLQNLCRICDFLGNSPVYPKSLVQESSARGSARFCKGFCSKLRAATEQYQQSVSGEGSAIITSASLIAQTMDCVPYHVAKACAVAGDANSVTDWAQFIVQQLLTGTVYCTTAFDRHAFSSDSASNTRLAARGKLHLSAFVVFVPFSGWVRTLLQAVAGVVVAWWKKIMTAGWGVCRPPQAVGGNRQSLIRQVLFTRICSLLLGALFWPYVSCHKYSVMVSTDKQSLVFLPPPALRLVSSATEVHCLLKGPAMTYTATVRNLSYTSALLHSSRACCSYFQHCLDLQILHAIGKAIRL